MRRDEAVSFLKEVTAACANMSPDSVALFHAHPTDPKSTGYQVQIKTILDSETREQVQTIAERHSLALKQEKDKVVIYKPREAAEITQ